jgi:hypothetical protein
VLGVAFAFCALARVPAYVQGGLVTPLPGQHASRSSSPASVLLFPVSFRDHAQTGRRLRVQLLDGQQPVGATLTVTRTQILSPREVTGRFHLAPGQGDTISGPVVVATARPSSATDEQTVSRLGAGTVEPAHARSGSQSLLSLMM